MPEISGFFKEFRFLSNFWPAEVVLDGKTYPTVEHAYQAAKTLDPVEREEIRTASTPKRAKHLSYKIKAKRSNWVEKKIEIMRDLLRQKFSHPELRQALDATKGFDLIETNTWNEIFWGICDGVGENNLGKLIMEIRDKTD
jgi:ribA/ribD-fused uncharacterized protein